MIIIKNPHFSQYRVSRDSLPTQLSNLDHEPEGNSNKSDYLHLTFDFLLCFLHDECC